MSDVSVISSLHYSRHIRRRLKFRIPQWAKWLAIDASGEVWIYSMMPNLQVGEWQMHTSARHGNLCSKVGKIKNKEAIKDWRNSRIYIGPDHHGYP